MAGRCDIKGSIRKVLEDPHENRFILKEDINSIDNAHCRINIEKNMSRNDV